jgi:hypothetical protein
MPDFPSRTRLAGFRWRLKPKLAPEAVVAGLEVRTRYALFCHYSLTSLFAASPFRQYCAILVGVFKKYDSRPACLQLMLVC